MMAAQAGIQTMGQTKRCSGDSVMGQILYQRRLWLQQKYERERIKDRYV